jgi:O-antigen/teichoic acid export membrane protein
MSPNRRIFLNIIATYGRSLYALVVGLFCGRWTLMALGEVDYGLMGVVGGLTAFISFLNGVMASGVGRFYAISVGAAKKDPVTGLEKCREWFTTAVVIHTVLPVVLMAMGYPIGEWAVRHYLTIPPDRIEACVWVWRFACVSCFVGMASVPYHAMYGAKQEIAELTVYSFVTTTLNAVFLYYMIGHPGDWMSRFAFWGCLLSVVPSLVITWRSVLKYQECRFRKAYVGCWSRIKEMLAYGGWISTGVFANLLKEQGIGVLVNKSFGSRVNASMTVGNAVSAHCTSLSGSLTGAFWPAIMNAYGEGDHDGARAMAFRVSKMAVLFVYVFAIPLILEIDEVLRLWLVNPPRYAAGICIGMLSVVVLDKLTTGHMILINAHGRLAAYQIVVGGVSLLALPLAGMLIVLGGNVYWVVGALLAVMAVQSLLRIAFASCLVHMTILNSFLRLVLPLAVVALSSFAVGLVPRFFCPCSGLRVVFTTALVELCLIPLSWFFVCDGCERNFILSKISRAKVMAVGFLS